MLCPGPTEPRMYPGLDTKAGSCTSEEGHRRDLGSSGMTKTMPGATGALCYCRPDPLLENVTAGPGVAAAIEAASYACGEGQESAFLTDLAMPGSALLRTPDTSATTGPATNAGIQAVPDQCGDSHAKKCWGSSFSRSVRGFKRFPIKLNYVPNARPSTYFCPC